MTITDEERQRLLAGKDHETVDTHEHPVVVYRPQRSGVLASLIGMLAGLGMFTILVAISSTVALVAGVEVDLVNGELDQLSVVGLAAAAAILLVSCFVGGFVAGRVARYRGMVPGLGSALWLLAVLAGLGGLALLVNEFSPTFDGIDLADRLATLDASNLALAGAIAAGAVFLLSLVTGLLGGRLGETERNDEAHQVVDVRDDV